MKKSTEKCLEKRVRPHGRKVLAQHRVRLVADVLRLVVMQLLELVEAAARLDGDGERVARQVVALLQRAAAAQQILNALERDRHDLAVDRLEELAQRRNAALRDKVGELVLVAARRGVRDGPRGLLLDVELGAPQQVDQRRHEVGVDDLLDLAVGARRNVGNGPAHLLANAALVVGQQVQQLRQLGAVEHHLRIDYGILVGAGIHQQPRAVRATMAGSMNQRRPSELRFLCAAAVRRRKVTRAHRDTNAHPQIPTRKYANDDDVISERYAKR
jgi:hypothetical protein